ncbi:MAG: YbhN family protein [Anaerolineaceae bacterium]
MANLQETTPPPKKKIWRYLIILVVLGLAVNLLLPQISDLKDSWKVVQGMTWWAVGLAVGAEIISYLGYGYCIHSIVALHKHKLSTPKGSLIAMSSMSIGLVAGGWFAVAGSTFGSVKRQTGDATTATMAGLLPSLLLNVAIEIIAIIGIIYLLILDKLTQSQLIQYAIFLLILTINTFGTLIALYFPKQAYSVVNWALWHWAKWRKKPYDPQNTKDMLNNFIISWKALSKGQWHRPFLGAFVYTCFDMLAMYFLFLAAGYSVNAGVLFAGYGLPYLLSKIAFIFPGGIGVVEASMAAIFTSLGVPNEIGVVVILSYRLFSFWLPTMLGFLAMGYLSRDKNRLNPQT